MNFIGLIGLTLIPQYAFGQTDIQKRLEGRIPSERLKLIDSISKSADKGVLCKGPNCATLVSVFKGYTTLLAQQGVDFLADKCEVLPADEEPKFGDVGVLFEYDRLWETHEISFNHVFVHLGDSEVLSKRGYRHNTPTKIQSHSDELEYYANRDSYTFNGRAGGADVYLGPNWDGQQVWHIEADQARQLGLGKYDHKEEERFSWQLIEVVFRCQDAATSPKPLAEEIPTFNEIQKRAIALECETNRMTLDWSNLEMPLIMELQDKIDELRNDFDGSDLYRALDFAFNSRAEMGEIDSAGIDVSYDKERSAVNELDISLNRLKRQSIRLMGTRRRQINGENEDDFL